ncbi:MAG: 4Fe-4S binding protein [Dehalococcoidales bacterium]|nr:4Fe-4S binding protein [Dehalococcoidales bacterium]
MPEINQDKCNLCGLCIEICRCGAIILVGNIVSFIEIEECHWCTLCEAICPTGALTCSFEIIIEER